VLTIAPRSPSACGVERHHAGGRLGDAAEGADQVDLDDAFEGQREVLDLARLLVAAGGLDRVAGAGAVDQDAFLADGRRAPWRRRRRLASSLVTLTLQNTPPSSAAMACPFPR
jgi:hypothetical protein